MGHSGLEAINFLSGGSLESKRYIALLLHGQDETHAAIDPSWTALVDG